MEITLNATRLGCADRPGVPAPGRLLTLALASATLMLATAATALPPLYPSGPTQGASNPVDSSDCVGGPAHFSASTTGMPTAGAGTTGQFGDSALGGPTATVRARPVSGMGAAYVGASGIPYSGGIYAAPGFGRVGPGMGGIDSVQSPQRMLALDSGQQPSAIRRNRMTTDASCPESPSNAIR